MWKKKRKKTYTLEVCTEITTPTGQTILSSTYRDYDKIRYKYNKSEKTLRAVLIRKYGKKEVIEFINVVSVKKTISNY